MFIPAATLQFTNADIRKIRTCAELTEDSLGGLEGRPLASPQTFHLVPTSRSSPTSTNHRPPRTWPLGSTIGVSFIGGSEYVRSRVKYYADLWTEHASVAFDFDATQPTPIRVAFTKGVGSWCFVGTSCRMVPLEKPTMNLDGLDESTPGGDFAATVLHEFGHALGCVHEHTPNTRLPWNKAAVYEYYERTQGLSIEDVDCTVLQHYERIHPRFRAAAFDSLSVMVYPIPEQFIGGQTSIGWNAQLSDSDKQLIHVMYPAPSILLDTGTFSTLSIRPWQTPANENKATIQFQLSPNGTPPVVLLGICWASMRQLEGWRLRCEVLRIAEDSAQINLRSWADTTQYSSGCNWLAISPIDADCQSGQFTTAQDHFSSISGHKFLPPHTSHRIRFAHPYPSMPRVAVWLSGFDCRTTQSLRYRVFATDITRFGFTINLDTWGNTELYMLSATWLAYSGDRTDICNDTIDTAVDACEVTPRSRFAGAAAFEGVEFTKLPRVFVAFSELDVGNQANLRVKVVTSEVSSRGMQFSIEGWADTVLYGARCTFVAFA